MPLTRTIPILAFLLVAGPAMPAWAEDSLTIYTYDSFTAEWGPGPVIEEAFRAECDCQIEFVAVADGVALLNRLRLEGGGTSADIVLGLDTNLTHEAIETGLFAPHGISLQDVDVPGGWEDEIFVPYDYGYFAFVYDTQSVETPPASMDELVQGGFDDVVVIQDPRTSTPGLGLLLWIKSIYGEDAPQAWESLQGSILTVTPGWSEAYGLFTGGEAPMVLSYTTSPAFHMIEEGEDRYKAAAFEEGHYLQVEVAGITAAGADNPLAVRFLEFMTGPGFQDEIAETNWMYPAGRISQPLHPAFGDLVEPSQTLSFPPGEVAENRSAWVDEWLAVMSR